jgi:tetratricopeptide (TPR) repeat protein
MKEILAIALLLFAVSCTREHRDTAKEPPVVIFRSADGRTLTMDDLRGLTGSFRYEIVGKSNVPAEAESLHQQARLAGESGDYRKAITLLEQACNLAPEWPYPVYDMAFTYLLMKDTENARKYYRKTVDLSPRGFFSAITAIDTLDREKRGDLPGGTYLAYLSLEWTDAPQKRTEIVHQLVKRVPVFAPGWKELAALSDNDAESLVAVERGLAANPDSETKGILQINRALILKRKGDREGAVRVLGGLALDPASTYATEHMAKVTLASIEETGEQRLH